MIFYRIIYNLILSSFNTFVYIIVIIYLQINIYLFNIYFYTKKNVFSFRNTYTSYQKRDKELNPFFKKKTSKNILSINRIPGQFNHSF